MEDVINDFEVFPNPAGEMIHINFSSQANPIRMELFNALGEVVWSEKIPAATTAKSISVEWLPKGIYILSAETTSEKQKKKLVIE
jgi:hypothetical protein